MNAESNEEFNRQILKGKRKAGESKALKAVAFLLIVFRSIIVCAMYQR
jgi:hypothetical protein